MILFSLQVWQGTWILAHIFRKFPFREDSLCNESLPFAKGTSLAQIKGNNGRFDRWKLYNLRKACCRKAATASRSAQVGVRKVYKKAGANLFCSCKIYYKFFNCLNATLANELALWPRFTRLSIRFARSEFEHSGSGQLAGFFKHW